MPVNQPDLHKVIELLNATCNMLSEKIHGLNQEISRLKTVNNEEEMTKRLLETNRMN